MGVQQCVYNSDKLDTVGKIFRKTELQKCAQHALKLPLMPVWVHF